MDALIESVSQVLEQASSKHSSQAPASAASGPPAAGPPPAPATPPSACPDNGVAAENGGSKPPKAAEAPVDETVASALKRVLEVIYFGEMFSGNGFRAAMERRAILSYEEFVDGPDATPSPPRAVLTTEDLDTLCAFADRLSTRPRDRAVSHKQALENCLESAMKLLGTAATQLSLSLSLSTHLDHDKHTLFPFLPRALGPCRSRAIFRRKARRGRGGCGSNTAQDLPKPILHRGARDADNAGAYTLSGCGSSSSSAGHQLHDGEHHLAALELHQRRCRCRCRAPAHARSRTSRARTYAAGAEPADGQRA